MDELDELSLSRRLLCILTLIRRAEISNDDKKLLLSLPEALIIDVIEEVREVRNLLELFTNPRSERLFLAS